MPKTNITCSLFSFKSFTKFSTFITAESLKLKVKIAIKKQNLPAEKGRKKMLCPINSVKWLVINNL
jgi:hypothetical protein